MPEFSFSGVASWQSEKMELDLKMPDRVNVSVDLNEVAQRQDHDLPTVNVPVAIPPMTIPVSDRDRYSASLSLKQAL